MASARSRVATEVATSAMAEAAKAVESHPSLALVGRDEDELVVEATAKSRHDAFARLYGALPRTQYSNLIVPFA